MNGQGSTYWFLGTWAALLLALLQVGPPMIRVYLRRPGSKRLKVPLACLAFGLLFFRFAARRSIRTADGILLAGSLRSNTLLKCIYLTGVYEPTLVAYIKRILKPGDVFLDIGANSGHFSLLAARLGMEVVSVEASPANCRLLKANIDANELDSRIRVVPAAAGEANGMLVLHENRFNGMFSTTCARPFWYLRPLCRRVDVPAIKMDELVEEVGAERIRLVKIDVEGAELAVIHGLRNLIRSGGGDLEFCLEFSPEWMTGAQAREIFTIFCECGYQAYSLSNREIDFPPIEVSQPQICRNLPDRQVDLIFSRSDPAVVCATT